MRTRAPAPMNWFDILQAAGDRVASMPWEVFLDRLPERLAERFEEVDIEPETPLVDVEAESLPALEPHDWVRVLSTLLEIVNGVSDERPSSARVIESPPVQPQRIITWAEERGLAARLEDPLRAIGSSRSWWTPRTTIREAMDRRAVSISDVRSYLTYALEETKRAKRRSDRARAPIADPSLARLRRRVLAFRDRIFVREVLPEWLIRGAELSIDVDEGRAYIVAPHERDAYLDLLVDDTPRLGRELRMGDERAELYQRLAELLLDVIVDPDEPQHEEVRQALNREPWERLLGKISAAVGDATEAHAAKEERLVWRVVESEGRVVGVDGAIQKRTRRGWSRGRRVKASSVLGYAVAPEDEEAVTALSITSERARIPAMLEALVGHPRVFLESTQQRIAVRRGRLSLAIRDEGEGRQLRFSLLGEALDADELADGRVGAELYARVDAERRRISIAKLESAVARLAAAVLEAGDPPMPASADEALMSILGRLPETIGLDLPPELAGAPIESEARPHFRLTPEADEGLKVELGVRPFGAEGPFHPPGEPPANLSHRSAKGRVQVTRDLSTEKDTADRWRVELGLDGLERLGPWTWLVGDAEPALELVDTLVQAGEQVVVEWPEAELRVHRGSFEISLALRSADHYFEVEGDVTVDEEKVRLAELMHAVRSGRRYVRVGAKAFARIEDELREKLQPLAQLSEGVATVEIGRAAVLALESAFEELDVEWDRASTELRERALKAAEAKPKISKALKATLRDYQEDGVKWLLRLAAWAPGACLADEMGLGKTVQGLAVLLARAKEGPALVVAPTSLGDNWCAEAARFAPSLDFRLYRGPNRPAELEKLGAGVVLVTSYDLMARDIEALSAIELGTVIFDEAQALKNPRAQRTEAATSLNAGFRLGLTGTPLENRLSELWSVYSVLVPGLLGRKERFRDRFEVPIQSLGDDEARQLLRRLIGPFLLRRTKSQVALELPPRTEVVRPVELGDDERALYEAERRRTLEELATKRSDPKQRFAILQALMRMRRLACHPQLVHPSSPVPSSKLESFLELASELAADGHRALVFSQFTSHLGLAREALEAAGHRLLYLDGSTPAGERSKLVTRFQEGEAPFFLISLRAGGTGLNLTAADTVVHLDPWWNPAVEDQASDRAHRIGQDKPVTVVRLISQGTIEEKVVALHAEKRELVEGILAGAETSAPLDPDALVALLEESVGS